MQALDPNHNGQNISSKDQPGFVNNGTNNTVTRPQILSPLIVGLWNRYIQTCRKFDFNPPSSATNESAAAPAQLHENHHYNAPTEQPHRSHHPFTSVFPNVSTTLNQMEATQITSISSAESTALATIDEDGSILDNSSCDDSQNKVMCMMEKSKNINKAKNVAALLHSKNRSDDNSRKRRRRKRMWKPEEDAAVLSHIATIGCKWSQIATQLNGRTGKQVRDRFLNYLKPSINSNEWTVEEDKLLIELYRQHGKRWCKIALHIAGRTEAQVKNRFYSQFKSTVESLTEVSEDDEYEDKDVMKSVNKSFGKSSKKTIKSQKVRQSCRPSHQELNLSQNTSDNKPVYDCPRSSDVSTFQNTMNLAFENEYKHKYNSVQQQASHDDPNQFISFGSEVRNFQSFDNFGNDISLPDMEDLLMLDLQN